MVLNYTILIKCYTTLAMLLADRHENINQQSGIIAMQKKKNIAEILIQNCMLYKNMPVADVYAQYLLPSKYI